MRIRGMGRVQRGARRLRNRFVKRSLILLYHRVDDLQADPFRLAVTPSHFAEHLEVIKQKCSPVRLSAMTRGVLAGEPPHGACAVTFDDGYADNYEKALPLLQKADVPATVFVATGYINSTREFWWDELERILLSPGTLPDILTAGNGLIWKVPSHTVYTEQEYQSLRGWNALETTIPTGRHALYRDIHSVLRPMTQEDRDNALAGLREAAGVPASPTPRYRTMTPEEIANATATGLVEIGAHTVTHPVLGALPAEAQSREATESRQRLEEITGRPVEMFSYPYGTPADYTPGTVSAVKAAGFTSAYSVANDVVWRGSDPYQIARVTVHDCGGEEFARRLSEWMAG